jgi:PAS domain S-box-containing protein
MANKPTAFQSGPKARLMLSKPAQLALRASLIYGLLGAAWIVLSDRFLNSTLSDATQISGLQTYKGLAFIVVTSALFFVVLRNHLKRWQDARHQAEAASLRHELLARHSRDIILLLRVSDRRILEANAAALDAYGFEREELLTKTIYDLGGAGAPPLTYDQLVEAANEGVLFETVHRRKDGGTFPVEVSSRAAAVDGVEVLINVVRDITDRDRSQQELRLSNAALTAAANAVVIADRLGKIVWVNGALSDLTGYSPADLLGTNLSVLKSGAQDEAFYEEMRRGVVSGNVWRGELVNTRKNGSLYHEEMIITPVMDGRGDITHFIAIKQDITPRIRAQEEILSAARFPSENPNPILRIDRSGILLHANEASYAVLQDWQLAVGKPAPPALQEAVSDALRKQESRTIEIEHRERFISFFVVSIEKAGYANLYGQDITERKRAEDALRQQADLLDIAPVFVRDIDNRIVHWGRGAQRLFGYTAAEAVGRTCYDLLRTQFPSLVAEIEETLYWDGIWEGELTHRTRDGSQVIVASRWVLHRDRKGIPAHILEASADITLRKEAEEEIKRWNVGLKQRVTEQTAELRQAMERAEASDRAKSDFLANMSHELRTPLNAVIGFSEILVDGRAGPVNPDQREYLQDILTSGRHVLGLVNEILDLARVASGKLTLNPKTFAIGEAVREVCAVFRGEASRKSIALKCEALNERVVKLDPLRFKQILYNLLSNAIKFTQEHGQVEISVSLNDHGKRLALRVKDTGIGVKQEDMPRLFDVFEQIDSSVAKRAQGSGLGLALTKKLVELQKGSISVESEFGNGSTFTVILPAAVDVMD